jgi:hypothetical protein
MVEARQDDGQFLLALNEIFVGHRSHQSARYSIAFGAAQERQSSSGVVVSTGTGASGWARSIHSALKKAPALPAALSGARCSSCARHGRAFSTGTSITSGAMPPENHSPLVSEMNSDGVVFGDGIESDHLAFEWGRTVSIRVSDVACASWAGDRRTPARQRVPAVTARPSSRPPRPAAARWGSS